MSTGALLGPGRLAEEVDTVQWVTREHPKTDRIACPWLIRRFIDPHAEILYVPADQVLAIADRQQAISFDAPGARYTHRDGLCSFEVLVADYRSTTRPWRCSPPRPCAGTALPCPLCLSSPPLAGPVRGRYSLGPSVSQPAVSGTGPPRE